MNYRVEVENRAAKQIRDLPVSGQERVMDELVNLQAQPRPSGCKKLKGHNEPTWRVRVGDYRILYRIHDERHLVRVYGVLRRDEAYR
ncbi:MAG: type II toxin-antitoxin system RelE/ParE family toxin [Armatimonadota bacterium]